MAVTATITSKDILQKHVIVRGTLAFSSTYSTGGDALNLASGTSPIGEVAPEGATAPVAVKIWGIAGYNYSYVASSKKIKVFTCTGSPQYPESELTAGAYPAAIAGSASPVVAADVVNFEATLNKGI